MFKITVQDTDNALSCVSGCRMQRQHVCEINTITLFTIWPLFCNVRTLMMVKALLNEPQLKIWYDKTNSLLLPGNSAMFYCCSIYFATLVTQ